MSRRFSVGKWVAGIYGNMIAFSMMKRQYSVNALYRGFGIRLFISIAKGKSPVISSLLYELDVVGELLRW